jgi:hypothetical protein
MIQEHMMIEWFEDLVLGMRFKSETVRISEGEAVYTFTPIGFVPYPPETVPTHWPAILQHVA